MMSHNDKNDRWFRLGLWTGCGLFVAFLTLPLASLVLSVRPATLLAQLRQPPVLDALKLSLVTSIAASGIVVVLGLPTAYWLATRDFRGKRFVETLVYLPMVLPPTVAGFALLLAFGRAGLTGDALALVGLRLPFSTLGVVVAQVFMSAPFFIAPTRAAFLSLDPKYTRTAATLRSSEAFTFWRVVLPLTAPSIVAAAGMCWARALGEFGATITFAGNMPGRTQTMPLAVYMALQSDFDGAIALSLVLVVVSISLLLALQFTSSGLFAPTAKRVTR